MSQKERVEPDAEYLQYTDTAYTVEPIPAEPPHAAHVLVTFHGELGMPQILGLQYKIISQMRAGQANFVFRFDNAAALTLPIFAQLNTLIERVLASGGKVRAVASAPDQLTHLQGNPQARSTTLGVLLQLHKLNTAPIS